MIPDFLVDGILEPYLYDPLNVVLFLENDWEDSSAVHLALEVAGAPQMILVHWISIVGFLFRCPILSHHVVLADVVVEKEFVSRGIRSRAFLTFAFGILNAIADVSVFQSSVGFVHNLARPRNLICKEMGRHRQVRTYHLKVVLFEVRHGLGADE